LTLPRPFTGRPACYDGPTGAVIDCTSIEEARQRALAQLAVSDVVLEQDLIPRLVRVPLPKTVADLPSPRPYSRELGTDRVVISGFDVWAPPPSGAVFSVENGGGSVRVLFTPTIDKTARATEKDGVTFEVWSGSSRLFTRHLRPDDVDESVTVDVPAPPSRERTDIALVTRVELEQASGAGRHATWQSVRFLAASTDKRRSR
jgi:hypothetical protein